MKPQDFRSKSPQRTTQAQCLEELARVMKQFGIADPVEAVSSRYVKVDGLHWPEESLPTFRSPGLWRFAIAEVEGKPVFIGDELYPIGNARECESPFIVGGNSHTQEAGLTRSGTNIWLPLYCLSWTPPKPKTVMVEMRVSSAAELARYFSDVDLMTADLYDAVTSIEKSLKESD